MPCSFFETLAEPLGHSVTAALLAGCLPEALDGDLIPIGEGDHCLAFRQASRVLRVAKHAEAAKALRAEACVLGKIADHLPLPVPRPTYREPGTCPPFSFHEEIRGEVLTREGWIALLPEKRERTAAGLAGFLDALHGLPHGVGRRCGLPVLDSQAIAAGLVARLPSLYPLLGVNLRQLLCAALDRLAGETGLQRAAVLIHRDIAPGHLLFDPSTGCLTGVIDFGDLAIGDPARDFIYIYEDFGVDLLDEVLSHSTREPAQSILPRIRSWYLLETVDWTIRAHAVGRESELFQGLREIQRELT